MLMNKNICNRSSNILKCLLEEIRNAIKENRDYGVTQSSIASELGITRNHFADLLSGKYSMRSDYLVYLICRLGLDKAH